MLTDYYKGSCYDVPARISLAAFAHAATYYHRLFATIEPPQIYRKVDLTVDGTKEPNCISGCEEYMISPLLLNPEWDNASCNDVVVDAGKVWYHFGGYHTRERDYALLNELKWFLVYKYNTELKWAGSSGEARMVDTLRAFAAVLDLLYGKKTSKYAPTHSDWFWDYIDDTTVKLFHDDEASTGLANPHGADTGDTTGDSQAFEWDQLLDDQWKMIVKRARRKEQL